MAKPEWGTKRMCPSCGTKFYDLGKEPVVCPSCGAALDLKVKASGATAAKAKPKPEKEVKKKRPAPAATPEEGDLPEVAEEELEDEVLDEDEALEDTDDLGEDGDDLQEVIEEDAAPEKE